MISEKWWMSQQIKSPTSSTSYDELEQGEVKRVDRYPQKFQFFEIRSCLLLSLHRVEASYFWKSRDKQIVQLECLLLFNTLKWIKTLSIFHFIFCSYFMRILHQMFLFQPSPFQTLIPDHNIQSKHLISSNQIASTTYVESPA